MLPEATIVVAFMVFIMLGLLASGAQPTKHTDVPSQGLVKAMKEGKRTALDEELEKRQKALKEKRGV